MENTLPSELLTVPVPPVALVGLDANGSHARLWKALLQEGGGNRSLRWLLIDDPGNDLPKSPKARRTSYEWFIPKGMLKTNWMNKHLNMVPAVAVVFVDLEWTDPEWNERKMECSARVQAVRAALSGRGTKIALVLIQRKEMTPPSVGSEENTASERATALCSACDLSARSLFVLPINVENLSGYIVRLENAFSELAQNYYHQEIRGVKGHRDYLNKTTHLYLFVRHQFKIGFLNELKRDWHAAYKHYSQAYNLLMEVRATDTNIMEVKTIGGFVNFKMCKLAFQLNLPRDAISQFRRHMDIFQHKVGLEELAFEHRGWQSNQCSTFAAIFADAIKHGLPAIQTQHPGLYYQQAAQYAIQRRKLAEEFCSDAATYPDPDPLINEQSLEFYGQRPWRPGKVSIEPPDMELEQNGIKALIFKEGKIQPSHSEIIVHLLRLAIHHYKTFRSPRAESNLTVTMAEELVSSQRCKEALSLLDPIVDQYRRDAWNILLKAVLQLALKCAFLVADVPKYLAFGLELASNSSEEEAEEKCRIMSNVSKLFQSPPKIPSTEPGLTSKVERVAVGEAAKLWTDLIMGDPKTETVTMGPELYDRSALKVRVAFHSQTFKADEKVVLSVYVKNNSPKSSDEAVTCTIPLMGVELCTEGAAAKSLKWEASADAAIHLSPGDTHVQHFEFLPASEDVGKKLIADKVILSIGNNRGFKLRLLVMLPKERPAMNTDFPKCGSKSTAILSEDAVDGGCGDLDLIPLSAASVTIDQREPQVAMTVITNGPALIGEWFHIKVELINNEAVRVTDVSVVAKLEEANDPIIADTTRLTLDYKTKEPETPATPDDAPGGPKEFAFTSPPAVKVISNGLSVGGKAFVTFYIRSSTTGHRGVVLDVSYKLEDERKTGYECHLNEKIDLETIEPFLIGSELLSCRNQVKLQTAYSDEPFLLMPEIKALSRHAIRIVDTCVELRFPMKRLGASHLQPQLQGCTLYQESVANECYALKVERGDLASSSLEVQDLTIGKYVINWIREDYVENEDQVDKDLCSSSSYELQSVQVCQSSLYAEAKLPAYAVARVPFGLTFRLTNRTEVVLEFNMTMESSDAFMLSGNKQQHFKISPGSTHDLNYVLYPLLAGEAVSLPLPKLSSLRPVLPHDDVGATIQRLLPSHITVLPRSRGKYSPSAEKRSEDRKEPFFTICKPVFVPEVAFVKARNKL